MIELELQAVIHATKSVQLYLKGFQTFTLVVRSSENIRQIHARRSREPPPPSHEGKVNPVHIQNSMEKGADHSIPDALSRVPIDPTPNDLEDEVQVEK